MDGSGNLYVADQYNHRIQKFRADGTFLSQFGTPGSGNGQFNRPTGVAVDGSGNLYVADQLNNRIQKFRADGTFLSQFGSEGRFPGQFRLATGVAVDGSGNIYVTDQFNNRIQKFRADGTFLSQFGSEGSGDGRFILPNAIAVDGSGTLYVADGNNCRIQKFNADGTFLAKFGTIGSGDGQLKLPSAIAVDGSGNVYVADRDNHRIQKFSADGVFLAKFGTRGSSDGQFLFPKGVAVDGAGKVYVADHDNHRIQVFAPALAEIALSENGVDLADGSGVVGFGSTSVGTPLTKTFTIANTGPASLILGSLILPAGFSLAGSFPASIASQASATFTVELAAASAGNFAGEMSFTSNDANENPFNLSLSGTVAGPAPQVASFSPGQVLRGETVVISGSFFTGATAVTFNSVDAASFTVDNDGQITATVPNGATTGLVGVTTASGTASSSTSLVVDLFSQTISFTSVPSPTYGEGPIPLSATTTSGLPVSFSLVSGPAQLTGNELILTGAGDVTIRASQEGNQAYSPALPVEQIIQVQPAVLTVKAADQNRPYGGENPAFTLVYSGFVHGEGTGSLAVLPVASSPAAPASHVGQYAISPAGGSDDNYRFSFVEGTLSIEKAPLIATADNQNRAYGAANPALTIRYTGFVNGDTGTNLDSPPTAASPAVSSSPAGDYAITLSGGEDNDYLLSLVNGTLAVGKAVLTATADNKTRQQGEANPALSISYSGFVNGDNASVLDAAPLASTTATPASPAGTYAISLSDGEDNNYRIVPVNGTLTVNPSTPICSATGTILRELWTGVRGTLVSQIPLHRAPNSTSQVTSFAGPVKAGNRYGARYRGYICAPVSGSYTFFLASDDNSELFLSSNDNPANKVKIASLVGAVGVNAWFVHAGQQSATIKLVAGQKYYVEALHKENGGGDHLEVGWRTPAMSTTATPVVIPGFVLSPFRTAPVNKTPTVSLTAHEVELVQVATLSASPNPFSNQLTVQFTPQQAGQAQLDLYTMAGVKIKTLLQGEVKAGQAENLNVSGQSLVEGMYLLRLQVGHQVIHHKIIFQR